MLCSQKAPGGYMRGLCPKKEDHFQTGDICYSTPEFQKFKAVSVDNPFKISRTDVPNG